MDQFYQYIFTYIIVQWLFLSAVHSPTYTHVVWNAESLDLFKSKTVFHAESHCFMHK